MINKLSFRAISERIIFAVMAVIFASGALANDGFYQGRLGCLSEFLYNYSG